MSVSPYRAASYELLPHNISLRQLSRQRGKSLSWGSNIAAGWSRWNLDFETALYEASSGDVALVERIRSLCDQAYELRHAEVSADV